MLRRVHSAVLILAVAWLLTLSISLPQTQGVSAQDPPPETWPDGRTDGRFGDLPHLAPGQVPQQSSPAGAISAVPAWNRLVFQSARDGNWEIYLANADGSNQVRLTYDGSADIYPRLNRGCTRIAFASNRNGSFEIYTMNLGGSGLTRLTSNGSDDVSPAWSPDGTRIAFESYRDGQGEIYVMNADGSNQVRLTWDAAWDGEPTWSPDGSQIAFTSYRNRIYRIWRMDADGSDQVQLSDQSYSEHPAWSPTGQIAFDADSNRNDWWELWIMNPDGSGEAQIYVPPEGNTDAWAGSWSSDGRYLAFTRISWVYQGGSWYWTSAYLDAWDSQTSSVVRLSGQGEDLFPDWQTADLAPPTSSVSALPSLSANPVAVSWSGLDSGPAGIASFDVQVRDGAGGSWTDWLSETTGTSAIYSGEGGHTYYFRSRARDNAGNLEAWPPGDGDASTTLYVWAISGTLRDNRETPVMAGVVSLIPEAFLTMPSDVDGAYAAYEAAASDVYTATWAKTGYGDLPPTPFAGDIDTQADMVLPPDDNVIQNWGFETGSLEPEWLAGGEILPVITSTLAHTGRFSAAFFPGVATFDPWSNVSNSTVHSARPSVAVDGTGAVPGVWNDGPGAYEILYTESARATETSDSILSQALTVPPQALAPTLSFWYLLQGVPVPGGAWFSAQVDDGLTNTAVFTATRAGGWTHHWVDLTPWAGQDVTLRFLVHQTEGQPVAWANLDEVSVGAAYPDLWVEATSPLVAPRGEPVEFTLTYGNRGGAAASQAVLTATLPPELPFVSANPPPTTITPYLTWAVGDLSSGSGPATITLVAGPAAETGPLTSTVDIGSASTELEILNNQAQAHVWIGWRVYLPIVLRHF